jgi:hypothetical protein
MGFSYSELVGDIATGACWIVRSLYHVFENYTRPPDAKPNFARHTVCVCVFSKIQQENALPGNSTYCSFFFFVKTHKLLCLCHQPLTFSVLVNGLDFSILQDYWNSNRIREFHISLGAAFIGRHRVHRKRGFYIGGRPSLFTTQTCQPSPPRPYWFSVCLAERVSSWQETGDLELYGRGFVHSCAGLPVYMYFSLVRWSSNIISGRISVRTHSSR